MQSVSRHTAIILHKLVYNPVVPLARRLPPPFQSLHEQLQTNKRPEQVGPVEYRSLRWGPIQSQCRQPKLLNTVAVVQAAARCGAKGRLGDSGWAPQND